MELRRFDRPPIDNRRPHLPLIRLPARGSILLAITCWEILQIATHYIGRRTLPCTTENCAGCTEQKPTRYEAYVSGTRGGDKKHLIVALTAGAAEGLLSSVPNPQQLRGHVVKIERSGSRPNGMVRAKCTDEMISDHALPKAPELIEHMMHIWGIDGSNTAQDQPDYAAQIRAQFQRENPTNGA